MLFSFFPSRFFSYNVYPKIIIHISSQVFLKTLNYFSGGQKMIPYEAYKVIHVIGVMLLLLSLGGYLMLSANPSAGGRKLAAITHGISVLIILVAGFGLLARLGFFGSGGWPLWVWVKLLIWLILAVIIVLIKRIPGLMPVLWFVIPALGAIAAYMAVYKVDF